MGIYLVHKVGASVVRSVENYWSLVHDDNLEMLVTNQQQQQGKLAWWQEGRPAEQEARWSCC